MKCAECGSRTLFAYLGTVEVYGCKVTRVVCSLACAEASDKEHGKVEAWRFTRMDERRPNEVQSVR